MTMMMMNAAAAGAHPSSLPAWPQFASASRSHGGEMEDEALGDSEEDEDEVPASATGGASGARRRTDGAGAHARSKVESVSCRMLAVMAAMNQSSARINNDNKRSCVVQREREGENEKTKRLA
jgi:hypothetical protein